MNEYNACAHHWLGDGMHSPVLFLSRFFFFFPLTIVVPSLTWYQIPKSLQAAGLGKVHILLNFATPSVGDGVGLLVHPTSISSPRIVTSPRSRSVGR